MNSKSPKPLSPNDFAHYVKQINPATNSAKYPLDTQTVFSRTMKSDKFTTASDLYTMTSVNCTVKSDKFTTTPVNLTIMSDKFTTTSVERTMTSVERTMNKYLFAFHFNIDNRQLSIDNPPL